MKKSSKSKNRSIISNIFVPFFIDKKKVFEKFLVAAISMLHSEAFLASYSWAKGINKNINLPFEYRWREIKQSITDYNRFVGWKMFLLYPLEVTRDADSSSWLRVPDSFDDHNLALSLSLFPQ